jgi:hypothetical protein
VKCHAVDFVTSSILPRPRVALTNTIDFACGSTSLFGDTLVKMAERSEPKVLTTREKILVEGLSDWVKLQQVHEYVAFEDPSAALAEVQRRTLGLVRSMAAEGVITLGNPIEHGARFKDWDIPLDDAMARLSTDYVDNFHDRANWPMLVWFRVTDVGKEIGRRYCEEYATWLADLRAQGREYEPLPLHLVPGGNPE